MVDDGAEGDCDDDGNNNNSDGDDYK